MGITINDFFENIYNVIFSPKEFFNSENIITSTRLAAGTIIFLSAFMTLITSVFTGEISYSLLFTVPFSVLITLSMWFLTGLFFEYTAKIFDRGGKLKEILFFTAFAGIPFIFFAPLELVKKIGQIGYFFGASIEFLLYLWIIILYVLALRAVYKITLARSFMLIILPFIAEIFAIYWIMSFNNKVWYIFSV